MEKISKSAGHIEDDRGNRVEIIEEIQVERILNPRESRCFAYGPDGKCYRVIHVKSNPNAVNQIMPHWSVMYEIRKYSIVKDDDGTRNFPATIREFIFSQFEDGEEMTPSSVAQLLAHAEHKNENGKYITFEGCYSSKIKGGQWSDKKFYDVLESMVEEVLINLFCETEDAKRRLVEENGVFSWKRQK